MDFTFIGRILFLIFVLGFFTVLISSFVISYRSRTPLLEIEKARKPIFSDYYRATLGLSGTRGRSMRVTIYDGVLVLTGAGDFFFEPNDIKSLELIHSRLGDGLKIKYQNKPYPPPIVIWTSKGEYLKSLIETSLHLKSNPSYGFEENFPMPQQESLERKRWFWLN